MKTRPMPVFDRFAACVIAGAGLVVFVPWLVHSLPNLNPEPRRPPKLPHLWPPKLLHLAGVI